MTTTGSGARVFSFSGCVLDERSLELRIDGQVADLDRKPMEVLLHLLRHAGEVVTKNELAEAVWPGRIIADSNLTKTVAVMRAALGEARQDAVKTVHGYGYRLVAAVSVQTPAPEELPARFDFKAGQSPPLRPQWQLEQRLGAGGQGEVWLAHHAKTKQARVFKFAEQGRSLTALKREVTLNRLLRETLPGRDDFLALLDWNLEEPPFFVESEYLPLGNLAAWAESRGGLGSVPLEVRLELMAQVADAVGAAHSVGVLHKDLKPANVLMLEHEGQLRIKLADFGSAMVVDPGGLQALGITQLGFTQTVSTGPDTSGTPVYRAPEVMAGQPFTVKSDVYALGVMLFQLVVGDARRALAPGWEKGIADELLREDIALAAAGDPADRVGDAAVLAQRLRTLAQRRASLEAERARRAQGERDRQDAATRSREAELVIERAQARRRWVQATFVVLAAGVAISAALFVQAHRARIEAERAVAIGDAVNDFLNQDLLGSADPTAGATKGLTLQAVLDRAARRVERLEAEPEVAARVRNTLGNVYFQQGNLEGARAQWQRSAELLANVHGAGSIAALSTQLRVPDVELYTGRIDAACALADRIAGGLAAEAAVPSDILRARYNQAQCLRFRLANDQAAAIYKEVKAALEALQIPDDRLYVENLIGLGFASSGTPQAEAYQRELLAYLARTGREHDALAARTRAGLGVTLMRARRLDEADRELSRAVADLKSWVGDAGSLDDFNGWLGLLRLTQGRFDEAAACAEAYLASPATRDRTTAEKWYALLVLAETRMIAGRNDEAVRHANTAVEIMLGTGIPKGSIPMAWAAAISADALRQQRKLDAAGDLLPEDLPADASANSALPMMLRAVGLLRLARGDQAGARDALDRALRASVEVEGEDNWRTRRLREELQRARGRK